METEKQAIAIARMLKERSAEDVAALYMADACNFTDYFVIATARSDAHLAGLRQRTLEEVNAVGLAAIHPRRASADSGWIIIDCGTILVHLMTPERREFYELERLWYEARPITIGE